MSDFRSEERQNSNDNVFQGLNVGEKEANLLATYLDENDFSVHTRRAIVSDLKKFVFWFTDANQESFTVNRVTLRDVIDFRNHFHREKHQAVATVNRALVLIRRFFDWLVQRSDLSTNPAKQVKEIRRQRLAPKGMDRTNVRKLLREVELRQDVRASAIFHLLLYTGCRVSDLAKLELPNVMISDRSGSVVFRQGKGNKQRTVALPLAARRAVLNYLEVRPAVESKGFFIGERGPLTEDGIRYICRRYSIPVGTRLHPHLCRHTFAKQFLIDNENDLVSLAQILGHENLNTTAQYSQNDEGQLAERSERVNW